MIEFETTEMRDRFFPTEGVSSEEAQQYFGIEAIQHFIATWATLSTTPGPESVWTDYTSIALGQ